MKSLYLLALGSGALLTATAAQAADWNGWSAGLNIGYNTSSTKTDYGYISSEATDPPGFEDIFGPAGPGVGNVDGDSAVDSAIIDGFIPTSLGTDSSGSFTGGAQLGYDHQVGQLVYGAQADFDWLNDVRTSTFAVDLDGLTNDATSTAGVQWLSTVRGRIGVPIQNALFFASGGLAFGDTHASSAASADDGFNTDLYSGSNSGVRVGYAVGGGVALALSPKVTLTGEYLYYNLGTANYAVAPANEEAEGEDSPSARTTSSTAAPSGSRLPTSSAASRRAS